MSSQLIEAGENWKFAKFSLNRFYRLYKISVKNMFFYTFLNIHIWLSCLFSRMQSADALSVD